jgi:hypothetical protein
LVKESLVGAQNAKQFPKPVINDGKFDVHAWELSIKLTDKSL